jgi:predicted RNA-binding protein with PIN domain
VYILIDGYNLIGTAHRDLEKARKDLIERLGRYSSRKGHNITLVFDGWKDGQGVETKYRTNNIKVIYSRIGENADSVIKKILRQGKQPWIVISTDREISDFAYGRNCVSVTSDEFEKKLIDSLSDSEKRVPAGSFKSDDEDDYGTAPRHKGNPKMVSKRLKNKLRALAKL